MSDEKKQEFTEVTCCTCGVLFGIPKNVEEAFRRTESGFHCINGHNLVWKKPVESEEQKELKSLRSKVETLQTKLATALEDVAKEKKRADDLQAELEIWRPSTPETSNGSDQTGAGDRAGE